jgi:membrane protease YdiL (CAAX protease family)
METTRSNQSTHGASRLAQLFTRYPVAIGFLLMFALTWPLDLGLAAQSRGLLPFHIPPILGLFVGYGFVATSLIMTGVASGRAGIVALLRRLLIWRVGLPWYGVVLFGAAAIDLVAIGIHVLLGGAMPDFAQPFARQLIGPSLNLWLGALVFLVYQVLANGEEFGWRGYALPRLQARYSALVASLIIGAIWAFWHLPKFLTAGDAHDYSFWFFALHEIGLAILFTWVLNNTRGSLLMALLFHAALNTADIFLPIIPTAGGDTRSMLIAMGLHCVSALVVVIVAGPNLGRQPAAQLEVISPAVAAG